MADLATLAHKMHDLPNFGAIPLAVFIHTHMSVQQQKQRESFMSLKSKDCKMNHCIVQRNYSW